MASENELYVKQMAALRQRLGVVEAVLAGRVRTGHETFDAEPIFIQLRKRLELIEFGSLCANKTRYSEVHRNFAEHWSAKHLLTDLSNFNRAFRAEFQNQSQRLPASLALRSRDLATRCMAQTR